MPRRHTALVLLLLSSWTATARGANPEIAARILDYSRGLADSGYLSGILVVAPADDPEPLQLHFGYRDADRTQPVDADTRICIASITKPMTAMAMVRLADEGMLSLDDAISGWAPDFPSGDEITLRDLLTHVAGVPHRVTTPEEEVRHFTPADIVHRIEQQGLAIEPHTNQLYSSAGYTTLAFVMERVTGKPYGDVMHELIFDPLGMAHTVHCDGRAIPHRATSFVSGPEGPVEAPAKDYAFLAGAGSLYSTADDLLLFARAVLGHELLSDAAWEAFHALGWATTPVVTWSGSTNGFACWLEMHQEDGYVAMFVGNAGTGAAYALKAVLPDLLSGQDPGAPPVIPEPVDLPAADLDDVVGSYSRNGSAAQDVVVRDGILYMGPHAVVPIGTDRFFNPMYLSEVTFERDEAATVTGYRLTAPGLSAPLVFDRVDRSP